MTSSSFAATAAAAAVDGARSATAALPDDQTITDEDETGAGGTAGPGKALSTIRGELLLLRLLTADSSDEDLSWLSTMRCDPWSSSKSSDASGRYAFFFIFTI